MMSLDDIARMRVIAQRLLDPFDTPAEAVRHLTCTQAQDLPGSTASIALRTTGRSLASVHDAYNAGSTCAAGRCGNPVAIAAEDLGWMLSLTAEKVLHQTRKRRDGLGLITTRCDGRKVSPLRISQRGPSRTRAEMFTAWERSGHAVSGGRGYHSLFHLAVSGVLCLGPMRGKEQCFVLRETWAPQSTEVSRDVAIAAGSPAT